jgi:hypothetical protein
MTLEERSKFLNFIHLENETLAGMEFVKIEHNENIKSFTYKEKNESFIQELTLAINFYNDFSFRINLFYYHLDGVDWIMGTKALEYLNSAQRNEILKASEKLERYILKQFENTKYRLLKLCNEIHIVNLVKMVLEKNVME